MSKTTLYKSIFCAALLLALNIAPALALPAAGKPAPRQQQTAEHEQNAQHEMSDAAKIAFTQAWSARKAAEAGKPANSSRKPVTQKAKPVSCEESWFFNWTKCCSEWGCCTWYGDGNGPVCI
ncbi:MAG TPA: hypothetical protein VEL74_00715 [Thermoanaerobaculia bacterium]|nr:hypothetical protein [Thermoanaerobaculia bacterium]